MANRNVREDALYGEKDYREAFEMFDENHDGKISRDELRAMMSSLGQPTSEEEIQCIMTSADLDCNGFIEFDEFVKVMQKNSTKLEDQLKEAFQVFDKDSSGTISADELKKVLKSLGEKITDDEVDEIIREIDLDGDGQVDYEEFVKMMLSKN